MSAAEEQTPFSGWGQIIAVLLLTAGAGAVWLQPLLSERPRPSGMGTVSEGVQHVSARLWQDPFGAVKKAVDKANSERTLQHRECLAQGARANERGELFLSDKTPCMTALKRTLGWLSKVIQERQAGQEKVLLIYALISGANGVGRDEARRRQRYALLAALNQEGYKPEDPEYIGYSEDTVLQASLILPFEWFSHIKGTRRAMVLWVDEETLSLQLSPEKKEEEDSDKAHRNQGHGPLARLATLHARISAEPAKTRVSGSQEPDRMLYPVILGPMSSTFLQKAQGELCRADEISAALAILKDIPWYSPLATLPEKEFFHTPCPQGASGSKKPLSQWLPNFIRATPTDDLQLSAMISEMERRGVKSGSTVVLIGQWDTAYTRYLERYLRGNLARPGSGVTVISANYLRGLDGRLPEQGADSPKPKESGIPSLPDIERPEGEAQTDYLRRLAAQLRKRTAGTQIMAVAVLGDDYHDKLMILEALRPTFPQAAFFTTDLDAAMIHPRDNHFTRNLVVVSAFGLSLRPELQSEAPPFRDSLQTATYFAARIALERFDGRGPSKDRLQGWLQARLFEIGRYSPIVLAGETNEHEAASKPCEDMASCGNPHPQPAPLPTIAQVLLLPTLLLFIVLIGAYAGFMRAQSLYAWLGVTGLAFVVSTGMFEAMKSPFAEPFSWKEGVSIWPSEIIRILAFVLSIGLILRGRAQITQMSRIVERRFGLRTSAARLRNSSIGRSKIDLLNVQTIWNFYLNPKENLSLPWILRGPSILRWLLFMLLLASSCYLIFLVLKLDMLVSPLRGGVVKYVDWAILFLTVSAFLALLFYVVDHVWRAIWLAKQLQEKSQWPDAALLHYIRQAVDIHDTDVRDYPSRTAAFATPSTASRRDSHFYDMWLDAELIATVTVPVQRIVFYPFAVLALLILARSSLFDNWIMPAGLLALLGLGILVIAGAAFHLRMSAECVRAESVRFLNIQLMGARLRADERLSAQLEHMLCQVRELRTGAFAPLGQQPLFRALLAIIGSFSGVAILEYGSMAGFL